MFLEIQQSSDMSDLPFRVCANIVSRHELAEFRSIFREFIIPALRAIQATSAVVCLIFYLLFKCFIFPSHLHILPCIRWSLGNDHVEKEAFFQSVFFFVCSCETPSLSFLSVFIYSFFWFCTHLFPFVCSLFLLRNFVYKITDLHDSFLGKIGYRTVWSELCTLLDAASSSDRTEIVEVWNVLSCRLFVAQCSLYAFFQV